MPDRMAKLDWLLPLVHALSETTEVSPSTKWTLGCSLVQLFGRKRVRLRLTLRTTTAMVLRNI